MHPHDTDLAEEWRPVVGFEGYYSVSSYGRIRRDRPYNNSQPGRILRAHPVRDYLKVCLSRANVHTGCMVHRAVAAAFIGPCPPGKEVNHRDGNVLNNAAENLEYVTRQENRAHSKRLGLDPAGDRSWPRRHPEWVKRGSAACAAKLTDEQVAAIRASYIPRVMTQRMLAQHYGVSQTTIWHILRGLIYRT